MVVDRRAGVLFEKNNLERLLSLTLRTTEEQHVAPEPSSRHPQESEADKLRCLLFNTILSISYISRFFSQVVSRWFYIFWNLAAADHKINLNAASLRLADYLI